MVGHVTQNISTVCLLLLGSGSSITCEITGSGKYSHDLPQGGMWRFHAFRNLQGVSKNRENNAAFKETPVGN